MGVGGGVEVCTCVGVGVCLCFHAFVQVCIRTCVHSVHVYVLCCFVS